jgi:hypothetical protein
MVSNPNPRKGGSQTMSYKRGSMEQTSLYRQIKRIRRVRNPPRRVRVGLSENIAIRHIGSSEATEQILREKGCEPVVSKK